MKSKPLQVDTNRIHLEPLSSRKHDLDLSVIDSLKETSVIPDPLKETAKKIVCAISNGASVIFMMGAHVIRAGVQRYIIDLMKRGYISCVAMNGAGMIHDYELALIGATTESVADYIREGRFGMWQETGEINTIVNQTFPDGPGMGAAVGRAILDGDFPHKDISLLAQALKLGIPVTVHVGIGHDIIHAHPNFNGAATGAASYRDFLTFAGLVQNLQGGVVMNFGSAVMGPEVFLKALSMARNVARQQGTAITDFTTLVCDLHDLPQDCSAEAPKRTPAYYFRPWKTMLVRTIAEGGKAYYVRGDHAETVPGLWTAINAAEAK
jgi:hypothetical protein